MKKYTTYLTGLFFLVAFSLNAQNHYNIRLNPSEASPSGKACYDIQLASADGVDLNLAGQNYRLYYDAQQLQFNSDNSQSLLSKEKYTALIVKDNLQDMDASGAGALGFDNHLSFLNIGNDLKDEIKGGMILPASGEWQSTATVCFDVMDNTTLTATDYGVFWARPELTQSYATAYVEIAEWVKPMETAPAKAAIYFDQELNTAVNNQVWENEPNIYPNPTADNVFIDFAGQEELLIQVYSANGQLLLEDKFPAYGAQHIVRLGNFSAGIYQLRLSKDKKQFVKRIEKIR